MKKRGACLFAARLTLVVCSSFTLLASSASYFMHKVRGQSSQGEASGGDAFYVSPDGTPNKKGNKKNPWDLATALSHPSKIKPGATIYLRGGTYVGKYVSNLTGASGNPITVRSYSGEWAQIDGYYSVSLSTALIPTSTSLTVSDASRIPVGADVLIGSEMIKLFGKSGNTFTSLIRGASGGGPAASHAAGSAVLLGGNTLDVSGSDTIYRDFEITNSWPLRVQPSSYTLSLARGDGIALRGPRTKAVNLVVHDCLSGITSWSQASDSEIYGCVIYNNGFVAENPNDPPHGHGMYLENSSGAKLLTDNIVFNNFNLGTQAYGVTGSFVGGRFEGNVYFNNGAPAYPSGDKVNIGLLIGTHSQSIPSVTLRNNYFYQRSSVAGTTLMLGYNGLVNGTAAVTGNYFGGGTELLNSSNWMSGTYTGNTFCSMGARGYIANVYTAGSCSWNSNSYYDQSRVVNCLGGNRRASFAYNGVRGGCGGYVDFNEWKAASGFDANSTYTQAMPPNAVFIRRNQYDSGRAHIIVYNWKGRNSVEVNVSGILNPGSAYEVRSAEDYLGAPVLAGTFDGKPLRLPMTGTKIARPMGYDFAAPSTAPQFGVFILIAR